MMHAVDDDADELEKVRDELTGAHRAARDLGTAFNVRREDTETARRIVSKEKRVEVEPLPRARLPWWLRWLRPKEHAHDR